VAFHPPSRIVVCLRRSVDLPADACRSVSGHPPMRFSAPSALPARRVHFPKSDLETLQTASSFERAHHPEAVVLPVPVRSPPVSPAQLPTNRSSLKEMVGSRLDPGRVARAAERFQASVVLTPRAVQRIRPLGRRRTSRGRSPGSCRDVGPRTVRPPGGGQTALAASALFPRSLRGARSGRGLRLTLAGRGSPKGTAVDSRHPGVDITPYVRRSGEPSGANRAPRDSGEPPDDRSATSSVASSNGEVFAPRSSGRPSTGHFPREAVGACLDVRIPRRGVPIPLRSAYAVSHDLDGLHLSEPSGVFQPVTLMEFGYRWEYRIEDLHGVGGPRAAFTLVPPRAGPASPDRGSPR
jgi:hypothetical protein